MIIVPQVAPAVQSWLFNALLGRLSTGDAPVNEAIELRIEDGVAVIEQYDLPELED